MLCLGTVFFLPIIRLQQNQIGHII